MSEASGNSALAQLPPEEAAHIAALRRLAKKVSPAQSMKNSKNRIAKKALLSEAGSQVLDNASTDQKSLEQSECSTQAAETDIAGPSAHDATKRQLMLPNHRYSYPNPKTNGRCCYPNDY